jgi:hypothetical protein
MRHLELLNKKIEIQIRGRKYFYLSIDFSSPYYILSKKKNIKNYLFFPFRAKPSRDKYVHRAR